MNKIARQLIEISKQLDEIQKQNKQGSNNTNTIQKTLGISRSKAQTLEKVFSPPKQSKPQKTSK